MGTGQRRHLRPQCTAGRAGWAFSRVLPSMLASHCQPVKLAPSTPACIASGFSSFPPRSGALRVVISPRHGPTWSPSFPVTPAAHTQGTHPPPVTRCHNTMKSVAMGAPAPPAFRRSYLSPAVYTATVPHLLRGQTLLDVVRRDPATGGPLPFRSPWVAHCAAMRGTARSMTTKRPHVRLATQDSSGVWGVAARRALPSLNP